MYTRTTQLIKITVFPLYLPQQSRPSDNHYEWAYTITIENHGARTVQLLNRYWHITDANGHVQEVRGPGVIGEQPVLKPGEAFRYTSGTWLKTPSGIMMGSYELEYEDSSRFEAIIPAFSLDSPFGVQRLN